MSSPTMRTLARCRLLGWPAQVVERWVPQARWRIDLFGCIDVLVLDGQPGCLGIQACAGGDAAKRAEKAKDEARLFAWLQAGNRFEVWAWRKVGARGKRKLWDVRFIQLNLADLRFAEFDGDAVRMPALRDIDNPAAEAVGGEGNG